MDSFSCLLMPRLETSAKDPERIYGSKLGLMRCHYQVENWQNSALYATKVLSNSQVDGDIKLEAHYARAMSNYKLIHYTKLFLQRENL